MLQTVEQRAIKQLDFTEDTPSGDKLAQCKEFLKNETAYLKTLHEEGSPGLEIVKIRCLVLDEIVRRLFECALKSWEKSKPLIEVSLVALGGYGRRELSPWSDLDLMFLFPAKTKKTITNPFTEYLVKETLYLLWDCGLKVGHSVRTVDEVFIEAEKNIQTKTSLLESRLIAGASVLYDSFAQAYRAYYTGEAPKAYIASRLEDQAHRRAKFADTVFNQEPDVKNGVGGLRDFQNTLWMARVKLGIDKIEELVTQKYLKQKDLEDFVNGYDFLLRVRNELHFQNTRLTDILTLDAQPKVAWSLRYRQADTLRRIERFMQDYYRAAKSIFRIAKLIESRLALTIGLDPSNGSESMVDSLKSTRFKKLQHIDGFTVRGGELVASNTHVFEEDNARLIRIFRHSQQLGCKIGFHLSELIRDSLNIGNKLVTSNDAAISFKAIMEEVGNVYPVLLQMHELGVLSAFIPEFQGLTCLVQHEYYHRYTADVHTLNAIKELDLVFTDPGETASQYRDALKDETDRSLIYITLLLHDIGKAEGIKGHSESGVRLAKPILQRLGINEQKIEIILFVIKNHLAMARFWQKRDVDDPQTISAFADFIVNPENLRLLYVHTYCDARATATDLWNSYKDTLHSKLYKSTLEHFKLGHSHHSHTDAQKKMTHQEIISKTMPGVSEDEIAAHFSLLPDRYFINTEADEVALHIQMVNKLLTSISSADSIGALKPIIDWRNDLNRSVTVVNVVTWDRAGLFYKLAGAFGVAGLNILGAKVITRTDHIAIDTFYVIEPGRGVVQNTSTHEVFAKNIEASLVTNKDLYPDIVAQAKKIAATRYLSASSGDTMHASFPPTVEVYHELSMERTIIEIQAKDQLGLLYRIAKTISERGFDITFARIGTERGVALDTFYIENDQNEAPSTSQSLVSLKDALSEVITPPVILASA
jgi:[protein-PII] uridylyltransferase